MSIPDRHWAFAVRTGKRIRELRLLKGMSLGELSTRARIAKQTLAGVERGRTFPSTASIRKIAEGLGCEPEQLFFPSSVKQIVHTREMTAREAIEVLRKAIRLQTFADNLPADIVAALKVMEPDQIRERLELQRPELQIPESKALDPRSAERVAHGKKLAEQRKADRERLLQLNYERMMWEANKDQLLKKPKIRED